MGLRLVQSTLAYAGKFENDIFAQTRRMISHTMQSTKKKKNEKSVE